MLRHVVVLLLSTIYKGNLKKINKKNAQELDTSKLTTPT